MRTRQTVFEYERELPQRSVADHEVFLSFNSDDDAYKFMNWMLREGERLFLAYLEADGDDD